ncbi:MAG: TetR/AcrR family transcriptional regulator [Gammaproteobacteria bacterium]|nr:MAG: TetR/AcrR family transcriptional regulator [Gammaproteobacteria bacterium]
MASAAENKRLSARDWADAALDAIARGGIGAVSVEPLARQLGVTKGSFYWHYANREALLVAALELWVQEIETLAAAAREVLEPRQRVLDTFRLASGRHRAHSAYATLAAHADHPLVRPALEQVARRRMDDMTQAYRDLGLDADTARQRAQLSFSAYLGFMTLLRHLPHDSMTAEAYEHYFEHVAATLVP